MTHDINQFLHEKVMKKCWHDENDTCHDHTGGETEILPKCSKCGKVVPINPSYTSWQDYGRLLEGMKKQQSWEVMLHKLFSERTQVATVNIISDSKRGSEAIARFFGWEE